VAVGEVQSLKSLCPLAAESSSDAPYRASSLIDLLLSDGFQEVAKTKKFGRLAVSQMRPHLFFFGKVIHYCYRSC
jgi:hypothetical protein